MRSLPAMRALCTPKDAPPPADPAETVNFFFIEDGEEMQTFLLAEIAQLQPQADCSDIALRDSEMTQIDTWNYFCWTWKRHRGSSE